MNIAVCQLSATNNKVANFNVCKELIEKSKINKAQMVFLPECFDYIAENKKELYELAEPLNGPLLNKYQALAKEHTIWLSLGGFHQKVPEISNKIYNTHIIINDKGHLVSNYNKIHMFDLDIPGKIRLNESETTIPGTNITNPVQTPLGRIGTLIDIRFPLVGALLRYDKRADILTYPSAFTIPTGKLHWEILNRCRAIENQCYVISAAQVGKHNDKRSSYGHSMVVDPNGKVLLDMGDETQNKNSFAIVELAPDALALQTKITEARSLLPIEATIRAVHGYSHLYDMCFDDNSNTFHNRLQPILDTDVYPFGPHVTIPPPCVFARNDLCCAFVNRSPVLPGHVLITTLRREAQTFMTDCTPGERRALTDLASIVGKHALIPTYFAQQSNNHDNLNCEPSFNVTIQDGESSGRTVAQVHMHIIPRHPNDALQCQGDDNEIYRKLAEHDKEQADDSMAPKIWRTVDDMDQEASIYRKLLYK